MTRSRLTPVVLALAANTLARPVALALVLVLGSALAGCSDDTGSFRPCVEGKRAADEFVRNEVNSSHAVKSTDFYLRECKAEAELGI